jgi:phosphoribulokinase
MRRCSRAAACSFDRAFGEVVISRRHPIISITGSSGAGTTSVKKTFETIFRRENVTAAYIEGDAFHRYDREEMRRKMVEEQERGNKHFSHFSPETNLFEELEKLFRDYSESGTGRTRHYVHDEEEARLYGGDPGTFTGWEQLPDESDLLFYEGLHGAVVTDKVNVAQYADLKIGVVPVINLEWIQKIHRDRSHRGYSTEAVTDTILRRMPDYVNYICPQFTHTDINFQRVPTVDTSNPFIARWIPTADESIVVIRFKSPRGIDFPYLLSMIQGSWMSRANSIVIPGGKLDIAMQLILTPMILNLVEKKRRAA